MSNIIAVVVSICALLFTVYQGYLQRKSYQEQVFQGFVSLWLDCDNVFIEKPELRPYFYENKPISSQEPQFNEVMAVAEMFDDVFSYSMKQTAAIPKKYQKSYAVYREKVTNMLAFKTYKEHSTWINNPN
jgi:hypothetical protein